jgi:hypothetical protein
MAAAWIICLDSFNGYSYWNTRTRNVKRDAELDHKDTYKYA